jgi:hypothetical protein
MNGGLGSRSAAGGTTHAGGCPSTFGANWPPVTSSFSAKPSPSSDATAAGPTPGLARWAPLQLAVASDSEAGSERKQKGTQLEKESGRQGGSSAEWRGKGLPLPPPWIYRSKGATLPEPCASRALTAGNGIRHRHAGPTMPKRSGVRACAIITARQPKGRGSPSRPPPRHPLCVRLRRLKRRAHDARLRPRLGH